MPKTKVAILGGGIGALAAAFDLTEQDPGGSLFDVTLYQVGWRLGGKCAVGWTTDGQDAVRYEHGLHVWAGFYDNAFDLLQRCYDATDARPFADWRDAFERLDYCWVEEWLDGAWAPWRLHLAPNGLVPGLGQIPAPNQLWTGLLDLVSNVFYASNLREVAREYYRTTPGGRPDGEAGGFRGLARRLATEGSGISSGQLDRFLNLLVHAQDELSEPAFLDAPPEARHTAILVNLGLALLTGMLDGNVLSAGFDGLDGREWSAWLSDYGAWDITLDSALVRGFYDYVFGAPNDVRRVGAGAGTRALMRLLFAYKGSFFFAMNMAMGDFLIAPLYKALLDRHVKFKFFHRVDKLLLSSDGRFIDAIELGIQVEPIAEDYDPLVWINNLRSWPNCPIYERLRQGYELAESGADLESPSNSWPDVGNCTLRRGQHFDVVVLGISAGGLKTICADLADRLQAWRSMLDDVETTPTMAMQLWLTKSAEYYGWAYPETLVTAIPGPLTTWGDNSQLIDQEIWHGEPPASLAYFVGNFPDLGNLPLAEQQAIAEAKALKWRAETLPLLWDGYDNGQLRRTPYVRININPSDRYVLSVPGSLQSRLRPDQSGVENLFLAGDWVRIGLNAGCVEQAVLGGRAAARAITGVDMNSQYDGDLPSLRSGFGWPSIEALAVFNLLPDISRVAVAGTGFADACCVVGSLPTQHVRAMLPLGLQLGPRLQDAADVWPLALLFVRHRDVRPGLAPPLGGLRYDEFLLIVPYVYHTDRQPFQGPFCYMPTILLDSVLPVLVGAGFYGLKKHTARIMSYHDSFDIRFSDGELSARFQSSGLPGRIQDFPVLSRIRRALEQVIIGETSSGSWVYSYLEHNLDAAEFQPIGGTIRSQGKRSFQFDFGGIIPAAAGGDPRPRKEHGGPIIAPVGFRMLTRWSLTYPIVRGHYEATPKQQPSVRGFASAMTERLLGSLPWSQWSPPR